LRPGDERPATPCRDGGRWLRPGVHEGPWTIDVPDVRPARRAGRDLDGGGVGTALTVTAAGVRIENLTVTGVGPRPTSTPPTRRSRCSAPTGAGAWLRAHGVTAGVHVEDAAGVRLLDLDLTGTGRGPASPPT
jgi:nitrous oxidase accessory protein NosD